MIKFQFHHQREMFRKLRTGWGDSLLFARLHRHGSSLCQAGSPGRHLVGTESISLREITTGATSSLVKVLPCPKLHFQNTYRLTVGSRGVPTHMLRAIC